MNQNNRQNRGLVGYLALLIIMLGALSLVNFYSSNKSGNTVYDMEKALSSGQVAVARITPDQVPPTEDLLADCARICDSLHEVLRLVRDGEI